MAKLTKTIEGVTSGKVYPAKFLAGDECPKDLEEAAVALGAVSEKDAKEITARLAKEAEAADRTGAEVTPGADA